MPCLLTPLVAPPRSHGGAAISVGSDDVAEVHGLQQVATAGVAVAWGRVTLRDPPPNSCAWCQTFCRCAARTRQTRLANTRRSVPCCARIDSSAAFSMCSTIMRIVGGPARRLRSLYVSPLAPNLTSSIGMRTLRVDLDHHQFVHDGMLRQCVWPYTPGPQSRQVTAVISDRQYAGPKRWGRHITAPFVLFSAHLDSHGAIGLACASRLPWTNSLNGTARTAAVPENSGANSMDVATARSAGSSGAPTSGHKVPPPGLERWAN